MFNFRTSGGRLHLVPDIGKIPLADALLIEDPSDHGVNDDDGNYLLCFGNCVVPPPLLSPLIFLSSQALLWASMLHLKSNLLTSATVSYHRIFYKYVISTLICNDFLQSGVIGNSFLKSEYWYCYLRLSFILFIFCYKIFFLVNIIV
jgi:hypothetical protein